MIYIPGDYRGGETPDPIPNSAVKPSCADGTWALCPGRVGRRRDEYEKPRDSLESRGFFVGWRVRPDPIPGADPNPADPALFPKPGHATGPRGGHSEGVNVFWARQAAGNG